MRRLSAREQRTIALVGLLGLFILWTYSVYFVGPLWQRVASLSQETKSAREKLRFLETATASGAMLEGQYQQLNEAVKAMQSLLLPETELPRVIELLSDVASQANVRIQAIFPQRPVGEVGGAGRSSDAAEGATLAAGYRTIPIQIDALAGYHQLGVFLSLVESQDKPMRIASLRIASQPKESKRHLVKLVIESYFSVGRVTEGGG